MDALPISLVTQHYRHILPALSHHDTCTLNQNEFQGLVLFVDGFVPSNVLDLSGVESTVLQAF